MNHDDVQLIGVFDNKGETEGFCYTVDLPAAWNLWVGAICTDGSRMGQMFMGFVLNKLIDADAWNEDDSVEIASQDGARLRAVVGHQVEKRSVEAFMAETNHVRVVRVEALQ